MAKKDTWTKSFQHLQKMEVLTLLLLLFDEYAYNEDGSVMRVEFTNNGDATIGFAIKCKWHQITGMIDEELRFLKLERFSLGESKPFNITGSMAEAYRYLDAIGFFQPIDEKEFFHGEKWGGSPKGDPDYEPTVIFEYLSPKAGTDVIIKSGMFEEVKITDEIKLHEYVITD